MQLFIILALLLYGGKNNAQNLLTEVKPVLESFGGEEFKEALKSAEEISKVISAVREFSKITANVSQPAQEEPCAEVKEEFPLSPIAKVANDEITYALSRYLSA